MAQSPEYAQAWSNLGAQYLQLTQVEAGISALEEAARLMPEEALIHTNLSYAYHLSSRWDRAETEVRKALQLDRNYMRAHYVLGQLLLLRGVNLEEAVENLKVAREEIPRARIVLANYYLRNAQEAAAEQELRAYMARAKGDDKAKAERWLAALSLLPRP